MHIVSHRGSSLSSARHPIHACAPVRCVVVVLFTRLLFLFVPLLFFRPFQMSSSEFHERLKSKDLRDFRLGTVATSDHETPLTETIAVSATIWISVGKVHHQIRLRILSCSRVSENHRGPEVPEVRVPVVNVAMALLGLP